MTKTVVDVKEIVAWYLDANGFDGLSCKYCSCFVGDIMPCLGLNENSQGYCAAGYKIPCPDPAECDCGGEGFHIGAAQK